MSAAVRAPEDPALIAAFKSIQIFSMRRWILNFPGDTTPPPCCLVFSCTVRLLVWFKVILVPASLFPRTPVGLRNSRWTLRERRRKARLWQSKWTPRQPGSGRPSWLQREEREGLCDAERRRGEMRREDGSLASLPHAPQPVNALFNLSSLYFIDLLFRCSNNSSARGLLRFL